MAVSQKQIERIIAIAKSYGATRLILFGSAVEMPEKARDIDVACDGVEGWKIFALAAKLEDELGMSLDIVPLSPPSKFTEYIKVKGKILL
ncbi:MAG: DNA polymerase III subunit beta [Nitrospinae bacterium RIFCSPLOWO2_02_39_17]|nr:MAG: DNA polymerase III subunit beta [Nitrospinae bacterium RIFCSPLOWO2_02_39_17]